MVYKPLVYVMPVPVCASHMSGSPPVQERETTACREEVAPTSDEQPDFLPMFPWYSGTSADMYRTIFGLVVSLKLFLGRFDMRTMQVKYLHLWFSHPKKRIVTSMLCWKTFARSVQ